MGAVPLLEGKTKRQVKPTEKGKEGKMALLEKKRSKLISRVIRKSSEIDDFMYSSQNGIAVKEELQQLNDMFKMLVELWFDDIDQKVFSFKYKVHNWLREVEKQDKSERSFKSSSKSSSKSGSSRSSKRSSTKERAVAEKLKVAELMTSSFIQKRREAELQAEALKVEQELVKAQARVKVLDKENKVDKSKAVISSGTERGKKVWLKEELHKIISADNSKQHHGIQNCYTFQEAFHYKEVAFKRNCPAWSTSDTRNYALVNEIWTPDATVPPSQDIPAENLLH